MSAPYCLTCGDTRMVPVADPREWGPMARIGGTRPCPDCYAWPTEMVQLARKAVEFQRADTRTLDQKIADSADFIANGGIGDDDATCPECGESLAYGMTADDPPISFTMHRCEVKS